MARLSWLDDDNAPALEHHLARLDHFVDSMEDGIIDDDELAGQEANLIAAMQDVEDELSDELHTKVTQLLVETIAFAVMKTIHGVSEAQNG